jgi:hypothetical protein
MIGPDIAKENDVEDPFRFADAFGPSRIIYIDRPGLKLRAIVVVDNTACGTAVGGVRMASDVSVEECFRLARAMTWKNAAASLPHGGGKSVIFGEPRMPAEQKGANHPRLRRFHSRHRRLHSRPGHGDRRTVHGLDQGRDRPRRRPA